MEPVESLLIPRKSSSRPWPPCPGFQLSLSAAQVLPRASFSSVAETSRASAADVSLQVDDDVDEEQDTRRLCPASSAPAPKDARLSEAVAKVFATGKERV